MAIKYSEEKRAIGQKTINIMLGSFEFEYSLAENGEIVSNRRDNQEVKKLRTFLTEAAEWDTQPSRCKSASYTVIASSKDGTQILLRYGCELPTARMFAVLHDSAWEFISPTNQFNDLGIPLCSHVDENTISVEVAPVCYTDDGVWPNPYSYTIRQ